MGLSKPIITTETDISGITSTLAEIKTLAQNGGGAVESVQQGIMQAYYSVPKSEKICLQYGLGTEKAYAYSYYVDITIANVGDITKCAVICETYGGKLSSNYNYPAKLVNSTTLRIYVDADTTSTESVVVVTGAAWQVIKYK